MSDDARETNADGSRNNPVEADHYVLGGGELGVAVARVLREEGHAVALVDETVDPADLPVVRVSPTDVAALRETGVDDATTVFVTTRSDRRNLLLAQSIRVRFADPRVIVVVNDPGRVDAFADAGHEVVCATSVLSTATAELV